MWHVVKCSKSTPFELGMLQDFSKEKNSDRKFVYKVLECLWDNALPLHGTILSTRFALNRQKHNIFFKRKYFEIQTDLNMCKIGMTM